MRGEFLAVHVSQDDVPANASVRLLDRQRALVESLGGSWHCVTGGDIAQAVLAFARRVNATQIGAYLASTRFGQAPISDA